MTITVGTDTFISLNDAEAYFAARLYAEAWTAPIGWNGDIPIFRDDATKEAALRTATAMLNRQKYAGRVASFSQPLAWPRIGNALFDARYSSPWQADAQAPVIGGGILDQEGRLIPSNTIPKAITEATAELALYLLRYDLTDDRTRRGVLSVKSERVGDSRTDYDATSTNDTLPAVVMDLISPFLASHGTSARLIP